MQAVGVCCGVLVTMSSEVNCACSHPEPEPQPRLLVQRPQLGVGCRRRVGPRAEPHAVVSRVPVCFLWSLKHVLLSDSQCTKTLQNSYKDFPRVPASGPAAAARGLDPAWPPLCTGHLVLSGTSLCRPSLARVVFLWLTSSCFSFAATKCPVGRDLGNIPFLLRVPTAGGPRGGWDCSEEGSLTPPPRRTGSAFGAPAPASRSPRHAISWPHS